MLTVNKNYFTIYQEGTANLIIKLTDIIMFTMIIPCASKIPPSDEGLGVYADNLLISASNVPTLIACLSNCFLKRICKKEGSEL